jgi:hypothetical protein
MRHLCIFALILMLLGWQSGAQTKSQPVSQPASQTASTAELTPEQIIQKFSERESEFFEAWMQYTYIQTAVVRVLSVNGTPQKETMKMVSEVVFNDDGSREVRLLERSGRLRSVQFTAQDQEVLDNIQPFALTAKELPLYNLKYEGREKIDELNCYVFSVSPKKEKGGRMYFKGKVWVDDQDLQIVRTFGKAVPETIENKFPEFETLRQVIDNQYWFPVWTHADCKLNFPNQVVRIEETITYDDYKKFASKSTIRFGTPVPEAKPKQ